MEAVLDHLLNSSYIYAYFILFFYTLGGGMVAIIAAGILSSTGNLNVIICILIASVSNTIGDSILFYLGRYNKKDIFSHFKTQRRNFALAQILIKKYGDFIIFIQKFIYGVKTIVPIAMGLSKYDFKKFTVLNIISSIIWSFIMFFLGYFSGEAIKNFYDRVGNKQYIVLIFFIFIILMLAFFLNKKTKKRSNL